MASENSRKKTLNSLLNTFMAFAIGANTFLMPACYAKKSIIKPNSDTLQTKIQEPYVPEITSTIDEKEQKSTWDRYGENIIYQNLSDIDFSSLPAEKIRIPSDLENAMEKPKVENHALLEKIVFEDVSKFGYKIGDIGKLQAKEAIDLAVKIVCKRLKYLDVDNDEKFIKKHGEDLSIEKYLEIGKGDCDKYADAFTVIFNLIKRMNYNLKNVYVSNNDLGGNIQLHKWNSLVFVEEDKLVLTHIDTTSYDNKGKLEGERGYHLPEDNDLLLAKFYKTVNGFAPSYDLYEKALQRCGTMGCKAEILDDMCFDAFMLGDGQRLGHAREQFLNLASDIDLINNFGAYYSSILFYSYNMEEKKGDKDKAERFKGELLKKFPDSYWVGVIDK